MLLDHADDAMSADVVIVGAGTMGLYLATTLVEAGKSVVVVEAGTRIASSRGNSQTTTVVGRPHLGALDGRASGLGGTSTLWGGQLAEFDADDFARTYAPWPITLDDVRPHYAAVYARLGVGAPEDFAAYRRRLGGELREDAAIERFFTAWLPQPNFAQLFRRAIAGDDRLRIVLNTTVDRVVVAGDRATAVEGMSAGRRVAVSARDIVFALGTIATSRFFLSTARAGGVPWADQPRIGHGFQDHLAGNAARVVVDDERRFRDYFENAVVGGLKLQPKLRLRPGARPSPRAAPGISGSFVFGSDLAGHLDNIKHVARALRSAASLSSVRRLPGDVVAVGRSFAPFIWRYLRDRRVMAFFDGGLEFQVQCEQIALASSRIRLDGDAPADDGLYRAAVDWRVDGREMAGITAFVEDVRHYLEQAGIGRLEVDPRVAAGDAEFMATMIDTNHHSGGMAMAASAADGVVDPNLTVFGTTNVYVAGAAVFPTSSHANCTLTALALTDRLAARLVRQ